MSFCPATVGDILLNERFFGLDEVEIYLMDIRSDAVMISKKFCTEAAQKLGRRAVIKASTNLAEACDGADFVIAAIEVDRFHYWSMDFHIPRRYGSRQVFGENGGPGSMFHFLRNLPPMVEIGKAMEKYCPGALLLNYTNPEAKLVDGVSKLTKTQIVGLCHGEMMGMDQLSLFLQMPKERIGATALGMNHFGFFTKIWDKETGEDLYPRLRENEKKAEILSHFDEFGLLRIMFRTYGLWPYPGTNHNGEYIAWADEFLASTKIQYYFDPASEHPWETKKPPEFIYSFSGHPTDRDLWEPRHDIDEYFLQTFDAKNREFHKSGEYGIPICEAIFFDEKTEIGAVNVPNKGYAPNLLANMAIELPATVDGAGIHPHQSELLPIAAASMINTQGTICQLVIEAFEQKSRNKLLQAVLLDPTVSNYHNSVAMINELCEREKDILPEMYW